MNVKRDTTEAEIVASDEFRTGVASTIRVSASSLVEVLRENARLQEQVSALLAQGSRRVMEARAAAWEQAATILDCQLAACESFAESQTEIDRLEIAERESRVVDVLRRLAHELRATAKR